MNSDSGFHYLTTFSSGFIRKPLKYVNTFFSCYCLAIGKEIKLESLQNFNYTQRSTIYIFDFLGFYVSTDSFHQQPRCRGLM